MIRNIVCLAIGVLLAAAAFPFAGPYSQGNPWLAVGVAVLVGAGFAVAVGLVWWAIERFSFQTFVHVAIEANLIALVVFTCVAFGGTRSWTWVVIEFLAACGVILWAIRMIVERRIAWVKTWLNLVLIALVVYVFLQMAPIPASLLKVFQSNTLRAQTVGSPTVSTAEALPSGGAYPVSLNRARTRDGLFLLMAYVAFFLLLINNITRRQQLGRMLGVVLFCVAFTAVTGIATYKQDGRLLYRRWTMAGADDRSPILNADASREFSAGYGFRLATHEFKDTALDKPDEVDFYVSKVHTGGAFGGFPSSNSAATVLAMGLVLALGAFFAYTATRRTEWGRSGGLLFTREGNLTLLLAFVFLVTAAALVLTKSRGGLGAAVAMLVLLVLLVAFSRGWRTGLIVAGVLALIGVASLLPFAAALRHAATDPLRVFLNPFEEDVRLLARQSAWAIIDDFPLFGTGLGTFGDVYPAYKVRGPELYFAHCDLLQWWVETGLVGVALAATGLGIVIWNVVVGYRRLRDRFFRRLLIAVSVALLAFLLHGLVDFPMAVPGVMILFVTLAAAAVVIARDQIARNEKDDFIF